MTEVPIRLVLIAPPVGVDFGIQKGSGTAYETLFVQRGMRGDICFDFSLTVTENRNDGRPDFRGPFVQGPRAARFVYVDVGTYTGQDDTPWARRMKLPLDGLSWALLRQVADKPGSRLLARIPGTGKDGGPNCATVTPIGEWEVVTDERFGAR